MCNCINEVLKKMEEHFKESNPNVEHAYGYLLGEAVMISKEGKTSTQLSTTAEFVYQKQAKSGRIMNKRCKYNIAFKYCPFCGKPYNQDHEIGGKDNEE